MVCGAVVAAVGDAGKSSRSELRDVTFRNKWRTKLHIIIHNVGEGFLSEVKIEAWDDCATSSNFVHGKNRSVRYKKVSKAKPQTRKKKETSKKGLVMASIHREMLCLKAICYVKGLHSATSNFAQHPPI